MVNSSDWGCEDLHPRREERSKRSAACEIAEYRRVLKGRVWRMQSVGALALVGSGEYLPIMQSVESALLDRGLAKGKRKTYVQIPAAAGQEGEKNLAYWKNLGAEQAERLGAEQIHLPIYQRPDAFNLEFAAAVKDAGLIYLSGGDPFHLAATLIDTPVWAAVRAAWESGTSLAGCSAGAMALGGDIPHFLKARSEGAPGLGVLPNVRTIPHYNKFFGWVPDSAARIMMQAPPSTVVIGVDEETALVTGLDDEISLEHGKWQVRGVGGVHILRGAPTRSYSDSEIVLFS
jgi:cyanophycinase